MHTLCQFRISRNCFVLGWIRRVFDWPISTSGVHLWPARGPFVVTIQNMDDGRDLNAVPYKVP